MALPYDVLDTIFTYLNAKDLGRAAAVCRDWREAARLQFYKRGPEALIIPCILDDEGDEKAGQMNKSGLPDQNCICNFLQIKPRICIIFVDDTTPLKPYQTYSKIIAERYKNQLPSEIGVIDVQTTLVCLDNTEIIGENNMLASILLPSTNKLDVKVTCLDDGDVMEFERNNTGLPHRIVEQLLSAEQEHTCIIMFSHEHAGYFPDDKNLINQVSAYVLANLKSRYKPNKFSLWGGTTERLNTSGCGLLEGFQTCWIAISLSGPTFKSWSIVMKRTLQDFEVQQKLLTFKRSVQLNATSLALMWTFSTDFEISQEQSSRITAFKKVFPAVKLYSILSGLAYAQFGVNSTIPEKNPTLSHRNCVTYLILTYT